MKMKLEKEYSWLINGFLLCLLMMITGSYALYLGQDANFDLRNYHWFNGFSFIHHRFDLDIAVGSKPGYNNPLLDALNYIIITLFSRSYAAEFALGALHGISLYFLFKIALIVFKAYQYRWFYSTLAVILGGTGVASLIQIGGTYNESQVSIFIMASLYYLLRAIDEDKTNVMLYCLAGIILGIGVGAKLTAMPFGIGIILSLLFYKKWNTQQIKYVLITGFSASLGFLIAEGYWMWKLYQHFQSPLFPYYNQIFHSKYAPFEDFKFNKWLPANLFQGFLYPFHWFKKNMVTQDFPMKDPRIAVTVLLSIFYFCKIFYKKLPISPIIRFLLIFVVVSFTFWMIEFSIYRYIIPLSYISGILIVFFVCEIFSDKTIHLPFSIFLTYYVLHHTYFPEWNRISYDKYFFTVELPKDPPEHALILVGWPAISYLATFLPESNQYIGYHNLMMRPQNPNFYYLAMDTIHHFKGPIFMMFSKKNLHSTQSNLARESLKMNESACQMLKSNMETEPVYLCPISDSNNPIS